MRYLLDTVAVIRHLSGQWKIGNAAATILDNVGKRDDCLAVSVVSLMEIMFTSLHKFYTPPLAPPRRGMLRKAAANQDSPPGRGKGWVLKKR